MTPIQAHIFDFDGILADTERLHWQAMQEVLAPHNATFSWETYERDYIGYDDRDALQHALKAANQACAPELLQTLIRQKAAAFLHSVHHTHVPPFPGAIAAVKAAAAHGPVALCTGALASDIAPLLTQFGIRELFQHIVTAEDVPASKPDPASYVLACKGLGIPPTACLAIEDTPHGLQAARGAGCQTLGVAQTHAPEALAPFADRVIPTLLDFIE